MNSGGGMKKLLCCLMVVSVAPAFAQLGGLGPSFAFGVHANFTNLNLPGPSVNGTSPLKDVYGGGYGGGVHADISFVTLGIRVSGDYFTFSPDNDKYRAALAALVGSAASQFSLDGGRVSILSANANAKMGVLPIPIISPYLTGGIGLARINADETKVIYQGQPTKSFPSFSSVTKTSFNIGAGVDFKVGVALFLEVKYTWILTDDKTSTYVPVTIGVTF